MNESDPCSNVHYLGSSGNKAWKFFELRLTSLLYTIFSSDFLLKCMIWMYEMYKCSYFCQGIPLHIHPSVHQSVCSTPPSTAAQTYLGHKCWSKTILALKCRLWFPKEAFHASEHLKMPPHHICLQNMSHKNC